MAGEPISSEFDFTTLQYTFRFCNYLQAPVPVVHVSNPEQSLLSSTSPKDSRDTTLANSHEHDESEPSPGILEKQQQQQQDPSLLWVGHPPEGSQLAFETEIFIPSYHYDDAGLEILVSDGDWRYVKERQTLYYKHRDMKPGAVHSIRIKAINGPTTAIARTQQLDSDSDHPKSLPGSSSPARMMKISGSAEEATVTNNNGGAGGAGNGTGTVETPSGCMCGIM